MQHLRTLFVRESPTTIKRSNYNSLPWLARLAGAALQCRMPAIARQKIILGEMRAGGVRSLLIYCSDFRCSHSTENNPGQMAR